MKTYALAHARAAYADTYPHHGSPRPLRRPLRGRAARADRARPEPRARRRRRRAPTHRRGVARHRPDVAILDLDALAKPIEVRELSARHPATHLVLIGHVPAPIECAQLLAFGASACLGRDTQSRDVINAIHLASRGLRVTPRAPVTGADAGGLGSGGATAAATGLLSRREAEVLPLLQRGTRTRRSRSPSGWASRRSARTPATSTASSASPRAGKPPPRRPRASRSRGPSPRRGVGRVRRWGVPGAEVGCDTSEMRKAESRMADTRGGVSRPWLTCSGLEWRVRNAR